jgi:hypothetical protein
MPEALKQKLIRQGVDNPYAVMNSMGAMKGSKITAKGRRIERKLRKRASYKDAGDALARSENA